MRKIILTIFAVMFITSYAWASETVIQIYMVNDQGIGKNIGEVTATDSPYGLILVPQLRDLPPGMHGFHVHQNADCGYAMKEGKHVAALAAGGHLDPSKTGKHEGPYGKGHLGDLPVLYVDAGGKATVPMLAPRLKVADLKGKSLMIHAGSDNYSDTPEVLGGGGARIACGVIK